ncbi:hypothetical protein CF319_g8713 [Tilletia indica]|nr:hypothetical protein CF319_g8713 [Tilletia indica]
MEQRSLEDDCDGCGVESSSGETGEPGACAGASGHPCAPVDAARLEFAPGIIEWHSALVGLGTVTNGGDLPGESILCIDFDGFPVCGGVGQDRGVVDEAPAGFYASPDILEKAARLAPGDDLWGRVDA